MQASWSVLYTGLQAADELLGDTSEVTPFRGGWAGNDEHNSLAAEPSLPRVKLQKQLASISEYLIPRCVTGKCIPMNPHTKF